MNVLFRILALTSLLLFVGRGGAQASNNNTAYNVLIGSNLNQLSDASNGVKVWPLNQTDIYSWNSSPSTLDVQSSLLSARSRNSSWLICAARTDYKFTKYTFEYTSNKGNSHVFPVMGRYDRGILLRLPSEYSLFYSDLRKYSYSEMDDCFVMSILPSASDALGVIPDYPNWGLPFRKPFAWLNYKEQKAIQSFDEVLFHYGYTLWFRKSDMALVRETVEMPGNCEDTTLASSWAWDMPETIVDIHYEYHDDESYPSEVSIRRSFHEDPSTNEIDLHFHMVNGFWMLDQGVMRYGAVSASQTNDGGNDHQFLVRNVVIE